MGLMERTRSLRRKNSDLVRAKGEEQYGIPEALAAVRDGGAMNIVKSVDTTIIGHAQTINRTHSQRRPSTANRGERSRPLVVPGHTIEFTADDYTFRFPTPSPRLPPKRSPAVTTPITSVGLAHGGPTTQLGRHVRTASPEMGTMSIGTPIRQASCASVGAQGTDPTPGLKKSNSSAWRSIFQRKAPRPPVSEPMYQTIPPPPAKDYDRPTPRRAQQIQTQERVPLDRPEKPERTPPPPYRSISMHGRKPWVTRGMQRQQIRAEMDRQNFQTQLQRSPSMHSPLPAITRTDSRHDRIVLQKSDSMSEESQDFFDAQSRSDGIASRSPPRSKKSGMPLLDVAIPKAEMERYSVMFDKLLTPPRQSLLERRQGTLKHLRPVGDDSTKVRTNIMAQYLAPC